MIAFLSNVFIFLLVLAATITMFFGIAAIVLPATPYVEEENKAASFFGGVIVCGIACAIYIVAKMISWM